MSQLHVNPKLEERCRQAWGVEHGGQGAALCSCSTTSRSLPVGELITLRVVGEVDLSTIDDLHASLTGVLMRRPAHIVVDLAELTFCDVRGLTLLVEAGAAAAGQGTGYAVAAASRAVNRAWTLLWSADELPIRYPTAAAGTLAAMASHTERRTPTPSGHAAPAPADPAGVEPPSRDVPGWPSSIASPARSRTVNLGRAGATRA